MARGPNCKSNPSPLKKITVLKNPEASVNNIFLSPCDGDNITLGSPVSNINFTYLWTGPAGYNETGQNPKIISNVTEANAGKYRLVIKNMQCVSDTATTTVAIFERPAKPAISSADIFCQGATFNMIASNSPNAEKYEWLKNDVLFSTTQENSLIVPNAQILLQGNWKVRAIKGSCKSEFSAIKVIAIDNLLEIGVTNSGPVCEGDSLTLTATFVPNATYTWQGPITNISPVSNPRIPGVPGEYAVTITTPTKCQNNANTTVSVIKVPEITALSNDSKLCMNGNQKIEFFPSIFPNNNDYTYKWTSNNGFNSNLKNPVLNNISQKDTGIYTLVVLNKSCPSKPVSTSVKFNINPPKPEFVSTPAACTGTELLFKLKSEIIGAEYIWSTPLGQIITVKNELKINNASIGNNGNYGVEIKLNSCTSEKSNIVNIDVKDTPNQPTISSNSPVCFGDTIKLSTSLVSGTSYNWMGPTYSSNLHNPFIINAAKANAGSYSLILERNGCKSLPSNEIIAVLKIG